MSVHTRTDTWVEIVSDLLDRPPGSSGHAEILGPLSDTFDAAASWNWTRPDGSFGFLAYGLRAAWPTPAALAEWARELRAVHPLVRWYALTNDPAALTIGRVPSAVATERDLAEVRSFYAEHELEQQLSLPMFLDGEQYDAFVLGRAGEDFSDEDVEVARQVQPLLRLLRRQAEVLELCHPGRGARQGDLSGREVAVLGLLAEGLTAGAIGRRLGISERTVHKHLEHVYRKLGTRDRLSTVLVATSAGLLGDRSAPTQRGAVDDLFAFTWRGADGAPGS